jgi:hypothetical protein
VRGLGSQHQTFLVVFGLGLGLEAGSSIGVCCQKSWNILAVG